MIKVPVEGLGGVFRLVYRSRLALPPAARTDALEAIFAIARARNALLGVTGALMAWQDQVVQLLEGAESAVHPLYDRIRVDGRHDDVTLLDADTVPDRIFPRWSMAQVGDGNGADIPVFMGRDAGPVSPAPDDPRQALMLDLMREYAHADVRPR